MRWQLSDEQAMFAESLRGWLGHTAPSDALRRWRDSGDSAEFDRALAAESWLGVGTPEEFGGQGGGLVELALAAEEFGRSAAPSSLWAATVLAVPALAGRADQLSDTLDKGAGAALVNAADLPADTVPDVEWSGSALRGTVRGVLAADRVATLIVPVTKDDGVQLVAVAADTDGVTITPRRFVDTSHAVADVQFDDAAGTELDVDARDVLRRAALRGAVLVAADALGAMDRMLAMSVEYSTQRHQFGVPIGSFQAVKHAAAEMLVAVEAGRSIVYLAAAAVDADDAQAAQLAAAAKAQVCAAAPRVADAALTVHGAIGYTWEYDLQLFYKRARFDRALAGSPRLWNERLAATLPLTPASSND